jgi:hypothetical protein
METAKKLRRKSGKNLRKYYFNDSRVKEIERHIKNASKSGKYHIDTESLNIPILKMPDWIYVTNYFDELGYNVSGNDLFWGKGWTL